MAEQDARDWAEAEAEAQAEDDGWGEEMVPVPVNEDLLKELVEMGFSDIRARKGIVHGITLEGALAWIDDNQDSPDIDQPYMVRKADTMPKPVLTAEEKALKIQQMKDKIKLRKEQKAKEERELEIKRERERRERGQRTGEIQEERDRMMRKREAEKQKREKLEAEKERARLRAEIARDKEIRRQNKGVLPSVLGVDGYNPSAVQYEGGADPSPTAPGAGGASTPATPAAAAPAPKPAAAAAPRVAKPASAPSAASEAGNPEDRIDSAIQTILKYRTANAGGNALGLLLTFVKNIADSPDEVKFRSVNAESSAYKSKLGGLIGPSIIFRALGFVKNDEEGKWKLDSGFDVSLFRSTATKLAAAAETFRQQNP